MNWQQELLTSFLWVLKVIGITAVLFPALVALLVRYSDWGRQFWILAGDFLSPKRHNWKPIGYFFVVIFFSLVSVRLDILFSEWYKAMYNALQERQVEVFWIQMIIFSVLATIHISNILLIYYIRQRFTIQWRTWLNARMLDKWTENQAYYKTLYNADKLENPDQRIQQDVNAYIESSLTFSIGLIKSVTSIFAFTIILWNLSGPMTIGSITIPHAMVFLVFIYVLISTGLAFRIGRPLIQLNFNNERLNADYRYSLIRVKEYAESIAFFRGENAEKNVLFRQFNRVIGNAWQIVYRTLKFEGFNLGVSQASVVFPFIIQAPRYFAEQIQLGDLIQTSNAFGKVQNSLSFFRNTYDTFAGYRAVLNRLTGFYTAVEHAAAQTDNVEIQEGDAVVFDGLTVRTPEGKVLVADLNMKLQAGDSLLIQGPSGAGKTTLLRSIAGLWGYCQGSITCPTESALFLSQKPYLPQGRLIDALCYPEIAQDDEDLAQAENVLNKVQLGHLSAKLREENDWSRVLSLGEQQRLTFARLLMHKPKVAFLDESTASMDEGLEFAMYSLLKAELPQTMIISVGHRSTLQVHHSQYLYIKENGAWELN